MSELVLAPRIKETTSSVGAGPLVLEGAYPSFFPFSMISPGVAKAVPYLIEWGSGVDAGCEWGIGEVDAAGTGLTRTLPLGHSPATLRTAAGGDRVVLPAGVKVVSLPPLDLFAVAVSPEGWADGIQTAIQVGPVANGIGALAAGIGCRAEADYSLVLGSWARALHDNAGVIGPSGHRSVGTNSFTAGAGPGMVGEQCFAGQAISGAPFACDACRIDFDADALAVVEVTAIGSDIAQSQFRVVRRRALLAAGAVHTQGADDVLVSTLGTVPTLTLSIGSVDGNGHYPLRVVASSAGTTAVDWRIYVRTLA